MRMNVEWTVKDDDIGGIRVSKSDIMVELYQLFTH